MAASWRLQVTKDGTEFYAGPAMDVAATWHVPDNVAVANGVVYAVQTGEQTLQHPDNPEGHGRPLPGEQAGTMRRAGQVPLHAGRRMMLVCPGRADRARNSIPAASSEANWVHFNQPAVAQGKVFLVSP